MKLKKNRTAVTGLLALLFVLTSLTAGVSQASGVVLPVRVNIYENAEGKTVVAYIPPSQQLAGFDNRMLDKAAAMLDQTLAGMVGMLGK